MIIAVQSSDKENVDENFGRANYFVLYDTLLKQKHVLSNEENIEAAHGAGVQSVALLARHNVNRILTYRLGEKAMNTIRQTGMQVFYLPDKPKPLSVDEALRIFISSSGN